MSDLSDRVAQLEATVARLTGHNYYPAASRRNDQALKRSIDASGRYWVSASIGLFDDYGAAAAVAEAVWPVGSIFLAYTETDPATLLGFGTWAALPAGRFLIQQDTGDPLYDTIGELGGGSAITASGTISAQTFTGSALGTHTHADGSYATSSDSAGTPAGTIAWPGSVPTAANESSHTHLFTQTGNLGGTSFVAEDLATGVTVEGSTGVGSAHTHTISWPAGVPTFSGSALGNHSHDVTGTSGATSAGTPSGTISQATFTGDTLPIIPLCVVVKMWRRVA